jgi:type VI secretion system protein ImpH
MQVSTDEFDRLHEAMAYVDSDGKPRQLKADESWRGISNRKTLHELLRRLETLIANDGYGLRPGWDQGWLRLEQAAELYFSGSELQDVRLEPAKEKGGRDGENDVLRVRMRHFGLFAPYGPLPIHVTEHAKYERSFERNAGFEAFLNLLSGHLAVLDYRAYANTHPVLSLYGHPRRAGFSRRLENLTSGWMAGNDRAYAAHIQRCRLGQSWAYVRPERSLAALETILARYFAIDVKVTPRHGRWIEIGGEGGEKRLGQWRVGRRIFDTQSAIHVRLGPVDAKDFPQFQRASERMKTMVRLIEDYTGGQVNARIDVDVRTSPSLRAALGKTRIGQNTWIKPSDELKTICTHNPYELL